MWLGGYIMIIRLEQVLDAIETADDAFTYFLTHRLVKQYSCPTP